MPESHYKKWPRDICYEIISNRINQNAELVAMHEEAQKELEQEKWSLVQQKYQKMHGKLIPVKTLRRRWEIVKDGGDPGEVVDLEEEEENDMQVTKTKQTRGYV